MPEKQKRKSKVDNTALYTLGIMLIFVFVIIIGLILIRLDSKDRPFPEDFMETLALTDQSLAWGTVTAEANATQSP